MNINIKKVGSWLILVLAFLGVFGAGTWVGVNVIAYNVPQPGTIDFSLFWDAYGKLHQDFITPNNINDQKIVYGAIKGMTESLGDPYTDFFDPSQAKLFQQDLSGSFSGIGVEIAVKKDLLTIISPIKGTPGDRAGLKPGDIIVKIDGKDTTSLSGDESVNLIRGAKGTTVTLTILRDSWPTTKDIKIVRDTIKVPSVEWSLKNNDVAYIQISQFNETLSTDFEKVAMEIIKSPAKKIVLDLRNNPGGYLDVSQNIAGWFLQKGQIVTVENYGSTKEPQTYEANGNSSLEGYPLVVLINQGSASASEILAGALRDNRNIKLIGMKSFGKGSVQEVLTLRGGSYLKITIAHWLTPKGNSISEIGLTPDIKVDITDQDVQSKKDPQLEKALEIVSNLK